MSTNSSSFDGEALGKQIVAMVREHQQRLTRTLEALEYALINYSGDYETGKCYPPGIVVRHGGSLWRAAYKTASTPGEGQAWTQWLLSQKETAS
jgi:hypothetical protein